MHPANAARKIVEFLREYYFLKKKNPDQHDQQGP